MNVNLMSAKNGNAWMGRYYKFRKQWYLKSVFTKLVRYKHGVILALALLFPTINTAFAFLVNPFVCFLTQQYDVLTTLFFVSSIHLFSIAWVVSQKDALTGQPFRKYFAALPLSSIQKKRIDLRLLFTSNIFFWILLVISTGFSLLEDGSGKIGILLRLLYLFLSVLSIQVAAVFDDIAAIVMIFLMNLLIFSTYALPCLSLLIIVLFFQIPLKWKVQIKPRVRLKTCFKHSAFPFLKMQLKILFLKNRQSLSIRCLCISIFFALSIFMASQGADIRFIYGLLTVNCFLLSGLLSILNEEHKHYAVYFKTLPIPTRYFMVKDASLIFLLSSILSLLMVMTMWFYRSDDLYINIILWGSLLPLSLLLCWINLFFKRYGNLVSFAFSTTWIFLWSAIGIVA